MKRFVLPLVLIATLAFGAAPALAHGHHGYGGFAHQGFYGYGHHHGFYGYGMAPFYGLGFGGYPYSGYGFGYPRLYSPTYTYGFAPNAFGMGFGGANYGQWGGFGPGF